MSQAQAEQGAFVAPAQAGTVQGPANGFGLRGLEIEFPAWRLSLPTIRFPSLFRTRANARMLLDRSEAAYMAGGYGRAAGVGQGVVGQAVGGQAVAVGAFAAGPTAGYAVAPGAAALSAEQIEALRAQEAAALAEQMRQLEAARAEAADAKAEAAEQKLRELEEAERRLDEKIRRLQECLQQLYSTQLDTTPPCPPACLSAAPPTQSPPVDFNRAAAGVSRTARRATISPQLLPPAPERLPHTADSSGIEVRPASYSALSPCYDLRRPARIRRLPAVGPGN